jgi:DNA-binding transcriptional ArsR family regulator
MAERSSPRPADLVAGLIETGRRPPSRQDAEFIDIDLMRILSDESRVRIYAYLSEREASRAEIQQALAIPNNKVRYHVVRLEDGGWIESRFAEGQTKYTATRPVVMPANVWDNLPTPVREHIAARIWKRLLVDVEESMDAGFFFGADVHLSLTPMVVDEAGRRQVKEWLESCVEGLIAIQHEADVRAKKAGSRDRELHSLTVLLTGYEAVRDPAQGIRASRTVRL